MISGFLVLSFHPLVTTETRGIGSRKKRIRRITIRPRYGREGRPKEMIDTTAREQKVTYRHCRDEVSSQDNLYKNEMMGKM